MYSGAFFLHVFFTSCCSSISFALKASFESVIISGDFYLKAKSQPQGKTMTEAAHCPFFPLWAVNPTCLGSRVLSSVPFRAPYTESFCLPRWDCQVQLDRVLCHLFYWFKFTKKHYEAVNHKFIFKHLFQLEMSNVTCKFFPAGFLPWFLMT